MHSSLDIRWEWKLGIWASQKQVENGSVPFSVKFFPRAVFFFAALSGNVHVKNIAKCDVLEGVVLVGKVARSTSRTPWWASLSNTHTRSPNRLGMERVSSMGSRKCK
eukprot:g3463.t1